MILDTDVKIWEPIFDTSFIDAFSIRREMNITGFLEEFKEWHEIFFGDEDISLQFDEEEPADEEPAEEEEEEEENNDEGD